MCTGRGHPCASSSFGLWPHRRGLAAPAQMQTSAAVAAASSMKTTAAGHGRRLPCRNRWCYRLCALRQLLAKRKRVVRFLQHALLIRNTVKDLSSPSNHALSGMYTLTTMHDALHSPGWQASILTSSLWAKIQPPWLSSTIAALTAVGLFYSKNLVLHSSIMKLDRSIVLLIVFLAGCFSIDSVRSNSKNQWNNH